MVNFLVIVFIVSLIYLSKVEMVKSYFSLMAVQGVLLFGLAFLELKEIHLVQLLFILCRDPGLQSDFCSLVL